MTDAPEDLLTQIESQTSTSPTRLGIVEAILEQININALRPLVRTEPKWRRLCAGFRPDRISKRILSTRKLQIARHDHLITELLEAFFKSLGIEHDDISKGLRLAALDTRLSEPSRELFKQVADADLARISVGQPSISKEVNYEYVKAHANSVRIGPVNGESQKSPTQSPKLGNQPKPVHYATRQSTNEATTKAKLSDETIRTTQETPFEWEAPQDHATETQQVVTLFERSLVAFVRWRLSQEYKDNWLTEGCGHFIQQWRAKAANKALQPDSLIGLAEIGDIKQIIVSRRNWPLFSRTFKDKQLVQQAIDEIIPLRASGMHAGERELYLTEHISAVAAMVKLTASYHEQTATRIDEVLQQLIGAQESTIDGDLGRLDHRIQTNLTQLQDPRIVGREHDLRDINEFWNDSFQRVASIVGAGGVGKTALLDHVVNAKLRSELDHRRRPDPEVIIYLTAKDNYLEGVTPAPRHMHFNTLREIYTVTLETVWDEETANLDMSDLRKNVLSLASEVRILFALDNLESLTGYDIEEVGQFLDELPSPSKAIITTRDNRRMGTTIRLVGLPEPDAREFLLRSFSEADIDITPSQHDILNQIIEATGGVPLYLKHAATAITQGGCTPEEALKRLTGAPILEFLEFSYANCFERLEEGSMRIAYFLALSTRPRRRNELAKVCEESGELDESIDRLDQLAFIERVSNRRRIAFKLSNPQIKEFVRLQVPRVLPSNIVTLISQRVGTTTLSSPRNVEIAIDKIIEESYEACSESWLKGIELLENARREWEDHPRILARLGYYYFRNHHRRKAKELIQQSVREGDADNRYELPDSERPDSYARLALIDLMDGNFDDAIHRARTAATLRPHFHWAEQILGQALYEKANRSRLMMGPDWRINMLKEAKSRLVKSLYADDTAGFRASHNERSHMFIGRIEASLSSEYAYA